MFSERDVVTETAITFSLHAISTLAHYNEICNNAFQIPQLDLRGHFEEEKERRQEKEGRGK